MKKHKLFLILALVSIFFSMCKSENKKTEIMKNEKQIIVDVRTTEEWEMDGHAACSVNYPLDEFDDKIDELKAYDKVVLVCRSGNRAGIAKAKLMHAGFTKVVENLGPWQNVSCNN